MNPRVRPSFEFSKKQQLSAHEYNDRQTQGSYPPNQFLASRSDDKKIAIISRHSSQKLQSIISNLAPLPTEESSASAPHSTNPAEAFLLHWGPVTLMQTSQISTEFLPQPLTTDIIPEAKAKLARKIVRRMRIADRATIYIVKERMALALDLKQLCDVFTSSSSNRRTPKKEFYEYPESSKLLGFPQ